MKRILLPVLSLLSMTLQAQPLVNSWIMNAGGKKASFYASSGGMPPSYTFTPTNDSADALKVCYNADTVWVYSHNMTDNMGKWLNPGSAVAQNYVHRFPRNPTVPATKAISPKVGEIGLMLNGIVIYGLGDAYSWNGTSNVQGMGGGGIWNREVGMGEGVSLDTAFGAHVQAQGVYHSHLTPFRFYRSLPSTQHSPIVGWAFDGYPIYGPYGYSSPMNASSGVTRMKSGYSLRNITTRTTYPAIPNGGGATAQAGPPVNASYPIGTYIEDYEWLASNGGDLDEFNGRMCVTPEFPGGTYAYFVTMDAAGKGQFPYYIGIYYKGQPDAKNFPSGPGGNGMTFPSYLSSCRYPSSVGVGSTASNAALELYPNPSSGAVTITGNGHPYARVSVMDMSGRLVHTAALEGRTTYNFTLEAPGVYIARFDRADGGQAYAVRVVRR